MRILHLLSNRKWTERAEPVADLVLAQQKLGHDAKFVCGQWQPGADRAASAEEQARRKGLDPIVLNMEKHFRWSAVRRDAHAIRKFLEYEKVDVIHAHMENAHLIAALAIRRYTDPPLLVKSSYEYDGPAKGFRSGILHRHHTDGLIVVGQHAADRSHRTYGLPKEHISIIEPGVDLERFDPQQASSLSRADFDLGENDFVLGVVSRLRRDRRMDLVIDALRPVVAKYPQVKLLVIGHGEALDDLKKQAEGLRLADHIRWAGYCRDEKLVAGYHAMNAFVYPVPGTDQSSRAVREALASGVPVVASNIGFLKELVTDGVTGRVTELDVDVLAAILAELVKDKAKTQEMAAASLAVARERFALSLQAEKTLTFYASLQRIQ